MKATISSVYAEESSSEVVASAISPDNLEVPEGVEIETQKKGNQVITEIYVDGKLGTLLNTIDDLLSCTSTAEDMI